MKKEFGDIARLFLGISAEYFEEQNGFETRSSQGVFSSIAVVWLSIQQRLSHQSLSAALTEAQASILEDPIFQKNTKSRRVRFGQISSNTGGLSRARTRTCVEFFQGLIASCTPAIFKSVPLSDSPVYVLDGQVCSMASTDSNAAGFGRHKANNRKLHYPKVRTVCAHQLSTGLALEPAIGTMHDSEVTLAIDHILPQLPRGSLIVGDRGYDTRRFACEAYQRGVEVLVRLTDKMARSITGGKLPSGRCSEKEVSWSPSVYELSHKIADGSEPPVTGRVIRFTAESKGFRSKSFLFFTTSSKPLDEIAQLYRQRVQVEVFIRQLKQTLKLFFIRAKTEENVHKEILIAYLTFNLLRATMSDFATSLGIDVTRLSFTKTLDLCRAFAPYLYNEQDAASRQSTLGRMKTALAQAKLPLRKKPRSYPREIKLSKASKYALNPWYEGK